MKIEQALLNRIWSETILTELSYAGVKHVCIAPGSRSTPLTLEATSNESFTVHTHFDERGLGFLALGLAKVNLHEPVAIIVTSGTAVANLLPAIAQAKLTGENLIVLTADRPIESISCGANQAIVQDGIFSSHVVGSLNLPSPSMNIQLNWLLSSVDQLLFLQQQSSGAIHINCQFPEPLYTIQNKAAFCDQYFDYYSSDTLLAWRKSQRLYTTKVLPKYNGQAQVYLSTWKNKKGIAIIGDLPLHEAQAALAIAQKLGWIICADPQSGVTSQYANYELWLAYNGMHHHLAQTDLVVQFGARIISKNLNQWLVDHVSVNQVGHQPIEYYLVNPHSARHNQFHLPQIHLMHSASELLNMILTMSDLKCETNIYDNWGRELAHKIEPMQNLFKQHVVVKDRLTEIAVALDCDARAKTISDVNLFFGNSLFIRLVDMFAKIDHQMVYANRGASGIDGLFATANGVVRASKKPLLMFIGDTSALYDLNSLALFTNSQETVVIVILNNDGGAIFDLLAVPEEQKIQFYQMPHGFRFSHIAQQFNLSYVNPQNLEQYQRQVSDHLRNGVGTLIVEVNTPAGQASSHIAELQLELDQLLN